MADIKKKEIYLCKSIEELNAQIETTPYSPLVLQNTKAKILLTSGTKLMTEAVKAFSAGDEEQAYILYMRAATIFKAIKKAKDYSTSDPRFLDAMYKTSFVEATTKSETLSKSLVTRYALKLGAESGANQRGVKSVHLQQGVKKKDVKPPLLLTSIERSVASIRGVHNPRMTQVSGPCPKEQNAASNSYQRVRGGSSSESWRSPLNSPMTRSKTSMDGLVRCRFGNDCRTKGCTFNHPNRENCRYGDNCFRNDCFYNHPTIPCFFVGTCTNTRCQFRHPKPLAAVDNKGPSKTCKWGSDCKTNGCYFNHPNQSLCRFDESCSRTNCRYNHTTILCKYFENCGKAGCKFRHPAQVAANGPLKQERRDSDPSSSKHSSKIADKIPVAGAVAEIKEVKKFEDLPTCVICLTDVNPLEMVDLGCSHKSSCQSCLKAYFETQISTGEIHGLKCTTPKCELSAPHHLIQQIVSPDLFDKLDQMLLATRLSDIPEIVYCPMPKCQRPVYTETEYGYCRQCDYRFCSGCNQAYHGAAPCGMTDEEMTAHIKRYAAADEAERARLEQETRGRRKLENDASEELIKNIFKKCPSCNASVEKISGCNSMHCTKCKNYFCWLCGVKITSVDPHAHFQASRCQLFAVPPETGF